MPWTKKCNRKQLLRIVAAMVDEFETRAGDPGPSDAASGLAYLRTAAHLRELLSIAQGRRSSTYWTRNGTANVSRRRSQRTSCPRRPVLRSIGGSVPAEQV